MTNIEKIINNIRLLQSKYNELLRLFVQTHDSDLTIRELKYLSVISEHEGERKTDIIKYLGVTKSTVSNIIKYLIKKNYILQTISKTDSRSKTLKVSSKGLKTIVALREYLGKAFKELEERLTEKQAIQLEKLMSTISK